MLILHSRKDHLSDCDSCHRKYRPRPFLFEIPKGCWLACPLSIASFLLRLLLLSSLLSACSVFSDPEYSFIGGGSDRVNSAGVHQMLDASFERIDLVGLLDPGNTKSAAYNICDGLSGEERSTCRIDTALHVFRQSDASKPSEVRNSVQDRLLAASDQRCNVYLVYIQRHYSASNFVFGSLTTVLGGAGALVSGAGAARALSGSAGVMSGVRAEYDQSYFYNQTINVISQGIRQRRKDILNEITGATGRGPNGERDLVAYTMEAAIRDAIRYHGACTLAVGLEQVSTTMSIPAGLENVETALQKAKNISEVLKDKDATQHK